MSKRTANGAGHIRQRKNGLWEAQYSVWEDGQRKLKSIYGKTQKEVRQKLTALESQIDNGTYIKPDTITLQEWSEIWQSDYLGDVKESTRAQYDYQFRIHINPSIGSLKLQKITPATIQHFYNQKKEKLSAKSIKNMHGVLHSCLDRAVLCGYLRSNPASVCILPRIEKKKINVISESQVPLFLNCIKGDEYENLYFVALTTGMRQAEILGLTWDNVDFKKGSIFIDKQLRKDHSKAGNEYQFSSCKNGKTRIIYPAEAVFSALKKEKSKQDTNMMKNRPVFSNKDKLVFTNEIGEHLSSVTVYNHLKRLLHNVGLDNIRFHDLRHTFATISISNGDSIKAVSDSLGHATTAFTMDVYGHTTDEMKRKSGERMNTFLQGLGS